MAMCLLNAAHEAMTTTITPGKLTGGKNTKPCEYYRLVYISTLDYSMFYVMTHRFHYRRNV